MSQVLLGVSLTIAPAETLTLTGATAWARLGPAAGGPRGQHGQPVFRGEQQMLAIRAR